MLTQLTEEFMKTDNKLILFKELVYVSEHQQNDIIRIYHDDLLSRHKEIHKIIEAIS